MSVWLKMWASDFFLPDDQELQEALASDPDTLKQRLGELSQKVTILKVNERALSRQYTLVQLSETNLRKVGEIWKPNGLVGW